MLRYRSLVSRRSPLPAHLPSLHRLRSQHKTNTQQLLLRGGLSVGVRQVLARAGGGRSRAFQYAGRAHNSDASLHAADQAAWVCWVCKHQRLTD